MKSLFNLSIHAKLANRGKVFYLFNTCKFRHQRKRLVPTEYAFDEMTCLTQMSDLEMTSAQIRVWPGNDLDVIQIHLTGSYSLGVLPQTQTDKNMGLGWASRHRHRNEDRQRFDDTRRRFGSRERNGELPGEYETERAFYLLKLRVNWDFLPFIQMILKKKRHISSVKLK